MRLVYTLLLIITVMPVDAQDKTNFKTMVGFGCYFEGRPSESVIKVTKMLQNKKYQAIAVLLNSKNQAEKYLAVISIERLAKLKKYEPNESERLLIANAKKSNELVSVCSGCTYFEEMPLSVLLSEQNALGSDYWLEKLTTERKRDSNVE